MAYLRGGGGGGGGGGKTLMRDCDDQISIWRPKFQHTFMNFQSFSILSLRSIHNSSENNI